METFKQIATKGYLPDGIVASKAERDRLVAYGFVYRAHGFNWLTEEGVSMGIALGILKQ